MSATLVPLVRTVLGALAFAAALTHLPHSAAEGPGSAGARPATAVLPALVPTPSPPPTVHGPVTAIVVLGYGLLPDGGMRPELIDRLHAGYLQALLAPLSPIIVTGGNARNGVTEARAMADWLIARGMPAARLHLEPEADTTAQNAARSATIMRAIGARDAVVITSADHIDRAVGTFHDAGVDVVGTVTPEQVPAQIWRFGPLA
ncbi:YdcF family protein [Nocardia abscessus]|uniref:YdcF family protein n=1 Tax=Nocardia abscessus TaxID=120957 RepID=A0ABS0CAN4_9NOCA|nr:YdcF family protein [Nocardia abscessus]MBF6227416.1 YdcF family protein [Nocardia abscessus]